MRGRGRDTGSRLAAQASDRLHRLARQWRPVPASASVVTPSDLPDGPVAADPWRLVLDDAGPAPTAPATDRWASEPDAGRLTFGPWNRSALRGIVVLVATALAITGWWWWSGRPRPVAIAPTLVAEGAPLTGLAVTAAPTTSAPAAVEAPAATTAPTVIASPNAMPIGSPNAMPATTPPVPMPVDAVSTRPPVVVHVIGLVRHPGLVELAAGARVADALQAAGGVTRRRAADSVNLARPVVDGEQIFVGPSADPAQRAFASPPTAARPSNGSGGSGSSLTGQPGATVAPMNLNTADPATLEALPGVGPVLADRIVMWRTANGPFRSVDELGEVSGIGDAIMAQLRPLVRV